ILRMMALAEGDTLEADLLGERILARTRLRSVNEESPFTLKERVEVFEERILREALSRHAWNISRVADELGLSRVGLRGKLQRYGLERV
ncbi:MAG: sigma-54-dependent Fis family transcriptional regulator, partial [Rhodospirillales bacterium]|nr:sigma-54-dependent Fis family transcriptional regulator [Rhodospirillales bacterium]